MANFRAGPRYVVAGGALKAKVLNRAAKAAMRWWGESMRGGLNPLSLGGLGASPGKFCKIYVSKKAEAIRTTVVPIRILICTTVVPIRIFIGTTVVRIRILIGTTGIFDFLLNLIMLFFSFS